MPDAKHIRQDNHWLNPTPTSNQELKPNSLQRSAIDVGAFQGNLPHVVNFGDQVTLTQIGNLWEVPMEGSHKTMDLIRL
jgi:hypothetical protein